MPQRAITMNASIREELPSMRIGDEYNLWTDDGFYATPGVVVFSSETEDGTITALGHKKANWPLVICESITEERVVQCWKPVEGEDGVELESLGRLEELQMDGSNYSTDEYPATSTVEEWIENEVFF